MLQLGGKDFLDIKKVKGVYARRIISHKLEKDFLGGSVDIGGLV